MCDYCSVITILSEWRAQLSKLNDQRISKQTDSYATKGSMILTIIYSKVFIDFRNHFRVNIKLFFEIPYYFKTFINCKQAPTPVHVRFLTQYLFLDDMLSFRFSFSFLSQMLQPSLKGMDQWTYIQTTEHAILLKYDCMSSLYNLSPYMLRKWFLRTFL